MQDGGEYASKMRAEPQARFNQRFLNIKERQNKDIGHNPFQNERRKTKWVFSGTLIYPF